MQGNYGGRGDGNRQRGRGNDNESRTQTRGTQLEGQWNEGQSSRESGGYDTDHNYGNYGASYDEGRYAQGSSWNEQPGRYGGQYGAPYGGMQSQGGQYGQGYGAQPPQMGPYQSHRQPYGQQYEQPYGMSGQYGQPQGAYGQSGQYGQGQYVTGQGIGRLRGQSTRGGAYAGESFRGIGPKGYTRSDERIKEEVCECLTDDDRIDASNISIDVKDGVVTLTGSVDERSVKHRVEDLVEDVSGVKDVENRLTIQRQETSARGASSAQPGQQSRTTGTGESFKKH